MRRAWRALVTLALLGPLSACNGFFYQPSRRIESWPEHEFEDVWLRTRDGGRLHGWFFPSQGDAKGTFVQFHGNAGNVSPWRHQSARFIAAEVSGRGAGAMGDSQWRSGNR